MSLAPFFIPTKAISFPVGRHAGENMPSKSKDIVLVTSPVSTSTILIASCPPDLEAKTIFFESGDQEIPGRTI